MPGVFAEIIIENCIFYSGYMMISVGHSNSSKSVWMKYVICSSYGFMIGILCRFDFPVNVEK